MPRRGRVDRNQSEIIRALKSVGATVHDTSSVANGFPDICAGYHGLNFLLEIKDGEKFKSETKLTPAEKEWHDRWRGSVHTVRTVDDALRAIGAIP